MSLYRILYKLISYLPNTLRQYKKPLLLLICITGISACSTPSENFHRYAINRQFKQSLISTPLFKHSLYHNFSSALSPAKTLHIYLDGDGSPWLNTRWIAKDPTARNPIILDLMSLDKNPAVLLGRPCYYGLHTTANCQYSYWTSHRYAQIIVDSMAQALSLWLVRHPHYQQLIFIGYSGGGTLAVLLAPHFPRTTQVVTIAANLDIDAWAKLHGYSLLSGSLNPINQAKLPGNIKQLHLAGDQDSNVPARIIQSYADSKGPAEVRIIENQSHCCWNEHWSSILAILENNKN